MKNKQIEKIIDFVKYCNNCIYVHHFCICLPVKAPNSLAAMSAVHYQQFYIDLRGIHAHTILEESTG